MKTSLYSLGPLAAFVALCSLPAQARPRDDAMAAAFRCASVGDSRQWLDCYYGAAQPVRAQLGMTPAPASQVKLNASPPGGTPQDSALRDDIMAEAARCIRAGSDRPWLDCYYGASQPMRARLGLSALPHAPGAPAQPVIVASAAPVVRAATPSGPPPMPRNPGLFTGMFHDAAPIVRKAPVKSVTFDRKGAFTLVLTDNQVWKQSEEDAIYHPAKWRGAGTDMLVSIAPSNMNTFNLSVEGSERYYKVHRVR
jgi:hypothetical protein